MYYCYIATGVFYLMLMYSMPAVAAKPIQLANQPVSILQAFMASPLANSKLKASSHTSTQASLEQVSSSTDFNQTQHIRLKQVFGGYSVWGADAILHIPSSHSHGKTLLSIIAENAPSSLSGILYADLSADLQNIPAYIFRPEQANAALLRATQLYQDAVGSKQDISHSNAKLIVYVDQNNKAHWAFLVSFFVKAVPARPTYILDVVTFDVYQKWNDLHTLTDALGGGFGGNLKIGKRIYDALPGDLPAMTVERDSVQNICYLENAELVVLDLRKNVDNPPVYEYECHTLNSEHNSLYWNVYGDYVNGGYSPSNDVMYAGALVKKMYQKWFGVSVLTKKGKPMRLVMRVHDVDERENAHWDGEQVTFGDGGPIFYPLTSLGITAHEVSHGFTEQHSGLIYDNQSGGVNESFSDMAAQAAEFYANGQSSWQVGGEVLKSNKGSLRYMDEPTKDCVNQFMRECSIGNVKNYDETLDVHHASGVFNRAFYLLATTTGWDTKKAFKVMVQANMHYWTTNSGFMDAACGVRKAAYDYKYDTLAIDKAMAQVGILLKDITCPL